MNRPPPSRGGPPQWSRDDRGPPQWSNQDDRGQNLGHSQMDQAPPPQFAQHDDGSGRGQYNPGRFPAQKISPVPMGGGGYRGPNSGYNNNYQQMPVHSHSRHNDEWSDPARRRPNPDAPKPKRAAKRRMRHDLPGPAGVWFRRQKNAAKTVKKMKREGGDAKVITGNAETKMPSKEGGGDNAEANNSSDPNANDSDSPVKKEKEERLFHDHAADLHESPAWNVMCKSLNRIIPPSHTMFAHKNPFREYRSIMRREVDDNFALISEINEGRYDTNHISHELHESDLRVPLFVGYVASVQCHAHSDWTALLVDELHSVVANTSKNFHSAKGANAGRGVVCWIEERLVKQHPGWVRPGVVWMIEGAKLALFSSKDEEDEDDGTDGSGYGNATDVTGTDISPSTEAARAGSSIDRVVLVGESSLVCAWTPEEAAASFGNREFNELQSRRNNKIDFSAGDVLQVDEEGDDTATIRDIKPDVSKLRPVTADAARVDAVGAKPKAPQMQQHRRKESPIDLEAESRNGEMPPHIQRNVAAPNGGSAAVQKDGESAGEKIRAAEETIAVNASALEADPSTSDFAAPIVTTSPAETAIVTDLTCPAKENTPQPPRKGVASQSEKSKSASAKKKKVLDDDPFGLEQFVGKRAPPPARKAATKLLPTNDGKENTANRNEATEKQHSKETSMPPNEPSPSTSTAVEPLDTSSKVENATEPLLQSNDSFDMLDEDSEFDKPAPKRDRTESRQNIATLQKTGTSGDCSAVTAPQSTGAACLTPKQDAPTEPPKIDTGGSFDGMLDEDEDGALCEDNGRSIFDALDDDDDMDFLGDD
ncbi:hypothetical protein ACHAXT_009283 [Thalassiosira profunda]